MKARISVPQGPGPHPVLCFLHGYGEAAPLAPEVGLTRHGPLSRVAPARVAAEFLVLAPQLPLAGDLWHRFTDEVVSLLLTLHTRHGGDPSRAYLSGFSFGGNGVFDLALAQPEPWAALWPVDPTRVPPRDPGLPVWLSFGEVARPGKASFIRRLGLERADGVPAKRAYVDEGDNHVGAARRAYADARIYSWLRSHARSSAP